MTTEPVGPEKKDPETPAASEYSTFSRVAAVWIWSIFFGLNTGVTASLVGALGSLMNPYMMSAMAGGGRVFDLNAGNTFGEIMSLVLPLAYMGGITATLGSWYFLYTFFSRVVLPGVFDPSFQMEPRRAAAAMRNLRSVYFWVIAAGILRYVPEIALYLAPLIGRMGSF